MNGAELPCGSILRVQPADSSYSQSASKYAPQLTTTGAVVTAAKRPPVVDDKEGDKKEDDDSDLDDFFDSLA